MVRTIEAAVLVKLNMVVSGGTGSGKTTLLNVLSSLIPNDERILTIEDSAELQLIQQHLVPFESRPPDKFGKGEVNMGHLLHSALRLRPDRIVVGEVRGAEAFDLMQAMNTGHGGSMATVHANTPTDTLRRLESLCLMSSVELPMVAVRAQVASAIHFVVCCERYQDGSRKTHAVSEVLSLTEKGDYRTQDLFLYTPVAKDEDGNMLGYHAPTGILPTFLTKARAYGFTRPRPGVLRPRDVRRAAARRWCTASVSSMTTHWAPLAQAPREATWRPTPTTWRTQCAGLRAEAEERSQGEVDEAERRRAGSCPGAARERFDRRRRACAAGAGAARQVRRQPVTAPRPQQRLRATMTIRLRPPRNPLSARTQPAADSGCTKTGSRPTPAPRQARSAPPQTNDEDE